MSNKETGAQFFDALVRSSKDIKRDRAEAIFEQGQVIYGRSIEDLELDIKTRERELRTMLDMSGDSALSLRVAEGFDPEEFVKRRRDIIVKLRELKIERDLLQDDFNLLFRDSSGQSVSMSPGDVPVSAGATTSED